MDCYILDISNTYILIKNNSNLLTVIIECQPFFVFYAHQKFNAILEILFGIYLKNAK